MIKPKGDLSKLAKWAQQYIDSLRRRVDVWKSGYMSYPLSIPIQTWYWPGIMSIPMWDYRLIPVSLLCG